MALTEKGISTTKERGQFRCETFFSHIARRDLYQWDYRDSMGVLHSGVAKSEARARLDAHRMSGEVIHR